MFTRISCRPWGVALLVAVAACGTSDTMTGPGTVAVASVTVTPALDTLTALGQSAALAAVARDADGNTLSGRTFAWTSANAAVASVASDGRVTAVGAGATTITVAVEGVAASATIVVDQQVAHVVVAPATWHPTSLGDTAQLTVAATDANDHPVPGVTATWAISDSAVVMISPTGLATAMSIGGATITAAVADLDGSAAVTVTQAVHAVSITPGDWSPTAIGTQQQFAATAEDANGNPVTDWDLTWESSDTAITVIDANGMATAHGTGAASIVALTTGATDSAQVMVAQTLASVVVAPVNDTLRPLGATRQLQATALDPNGEPIAGVSFTWSSSSPVALPVASDGTITANGLGTFTITATAGGVAGQATITVLATEEPPVVALRVAPEAWTAITVGAKQPFRVFAMHADGQENELVGATWSSSNPTVADVDASGLVTARTGGSMTLTATSGALSDTADVTVDPSGAIADGIVWSMYFAREVESPALLYNGLLRTPSAPGQAPYPGSNVAKFQWAGDRIGVLTDVAGGQGSFRVRDRVGEWVDLAIGNAKDFRLEGDRIGVLLGDGTLRIKDGTHGAWTNVAGTVASFKLEGDRIMALNLDGSLYAKDGVSGAWALLANGGVVEYQLAGNRIAVVLDDGRLRVKDGINGAWSTLGTAAAAVKLEGNRIGVLNLDGKFYVKDGINGSWVLLANGGVEKFAFDGNRIGELLTSGMFRVKDGINGAWTTLGSSGVRDFDLHKGRIGMVGDDGRVRVKVGGASAPWTFNGVYPALSQFSVAVAGLVDPYRTTPASYAAGQAGCFSPCVRQAHIPLYFDIYAPVPEYGRNCGDYLPPPGADRTTIDGMDEVCFHHDHAPSWYGNATGSLGNDLVGACIVRYGILNARMTRNGVLLTPGSAAYNQAWSLMPETAEARRQYLNWTSSCTPYYMTQFEENTQLGL